METGRWQHPPVLSVALPFSLGVCPPSSSYLLRGGERVRCRERQMRRCKMAIVRLIACCVLCTNLGHIPSSLAVILRTTDKIVWSNEFEPVELTCLIESISTNNPRIEWKKIRNGIPSYVYFQRKIAGDLENRAQLREPANILIFNATRADTAEYRCEVAAIDDQRDFDEILISLAVRVKPVVPRCSVPEAVTVGTSTELRCLENEGFPAPVYRWFQNNEELPQDPKNTPKFINATYTINTDTGSLKFRRVRKEDAGEYYCQAKNDAGHAQCPSQWMDVYDVDILDIALKSVGGVVAVIFVIGCIWHCLSRAFSSKKGQNENEFSWPAQNDGVDYGDADEGHFRHKSSFII
ncbi:junctional adhesion molecule 3B isoform X1 [Syngnathus acus]|uniref:junctional adhesion molecule 3B isoform X1 n=1 Tax=Syngnathus acus TaxID=161584 RepID=UPI0018863D3D|nr:junctional adhesion molecule 3B isoform X1 [Syngnathus acus]